MNVENMDKTKLRYVMIGECSKCGKELIRLPEVTIAACDCESATEVPLKPTILLRPSLLLRKLERLCPPNISLERFVNALMTAGLEVVEKMSLQEFKKRGLLGGSKK